MEGKSTITKIATNFIKLRFRNFARRTIRPVAQGWSKILNSNNKISQELLAAEMGNLRINIPTSLLMEGKDDGGSIIVDPSLNEPGAEKVSPSYEPDPKNLKRARKAVNKYLKLHPTTRWGKFKKGLKIAGIALGQLALTSTTLLCMGYTLTVSMPTLTLALGFTIGMFLSIVPAIIYLSLIPHPAERLASLYFDPQTRGALAQALDSKTEAEQQTVIAMFAEDEQIELNNTIRATRLITSYMEAKEKGEAFAMDDLTIDLMQLSLDRRLPEYKVLTAIHYELQEKESAEE